MINRDTSGEQYVDALDLDNRPGKNGLAAVEGVDLGDPVKVNSGSGGGSCHLYYKKVPGKTLSSSVPGIDIRTKGNMCVCPGSLHLSNNRYTFDGKHFKELADMPDQLVQMFTVRKNKLVTPLEQNNRKHEIRLELEPKQPSEEAGGKSVPPSSDSCQSLEFPPAGARSPGALVPTFLVLEKVKKDKKAGPRYFDGVRTFLKADGTYDRSRD